MKKWQNKTKGRLIWYVTRGTLSRVLNGKDQGKLRVRWKGKGKGQDKTGNYGVEEGICGKGRKKG